MRLYKKLLLLEEDRETDHIFFSLGNDGVITAIKRTDITFLHKDAVISNDGILKLDKNSMYALLNKNTLWKVSNVSINGSTINCMTDTLFMSWKTGPLTLQVPIPAKSVPVINKFYKNIFKKIKDLFKNC
jgi:hypothetical protein